ncbi:hypothetical protein CY34DRAFT_805606 [Suillus luteus UH-Slu-Lm8-n1]|uniref:Uncharacterized protein n=1 Tax=Suillus luteus UH-Slu-Lm8-n1 TaxID=930992 RepID=A0A0C9ZVH6_9AGAM|nr:hypothetical protein CY34DRAFT_805606 [Suillus luteus UH-Slu-Lm8-n1]
MDSWTLKRKQVHDEARTSHDAHCAHSLHKVFEKLRIFPLARPYLHAKVPGRVSQKLLVLQVSYATHGTGSWSMLLKMSNRFRRSFLTGATNSTPIGLGSSTFNVVICGAGINVPWILCMHVFQHVVG